jgi:hypothetical protein
MRRFTGSQPVDDDIRNSERDAMVRDGSIVFSDLIGKLEPLRVTAPSATVKAAPASTASAD